MIELEVLRGPASERESKWIVDLYGPADPKYADPGFVRHQFSNNPFGWSLHAFARDGDRPVGHCALIPIPARAGVESLVSGKFEAFAVDPAYQSVSLPDGRFIGFALLDELYERALESGFAVVHDLVQPDIGIMHRLHGARAVQVPWPTLVGIGDRRILARLGIRRATAARLLGHGQRALQLFSYPVVGRATVRPVIESDPPPQPQSIPANTWTIEPSDMWKWLVGTGLLAWVEEPSGGRALVRLPGRARQAAELLDWRSGERPLAGAIAAITTVSRLARDGRSVRIPNPAGDSDLRLASRILGLVPARQPLTAYIKTLRPDLDSAHVAVNPFFFATF